jgi:hypothetical protein
MKRSSFTILLLLIAVLPGCWIFFIAQPSSVNEGAAIDIDVALHADVSVSGMYTPVWCAAFPIGWKIGPISYTFRSSYSSSAVPAKLFPSPSESAVMNSNFPVSTGGVMSSWNCYAGLNTTYNDEQVWDISIDAQVGAAGAYTAYYSAYATAVSSNRDIVQKRTVVGGSAARWDVWETFNVFQWAGIPDNTPAPDLWLFDIAYGSDTYVASIAELSGGNTALLTAEAGESWIPTAMLEYDQVFSNVNFSGGYFLATSVDGLLWMSNDGIDWSSTDAGISTVTGAAHGGGVTVAVGTGGEVAWSEDNSSWESTVVGSGIWYDVAYGEGRFVAAGATSGNASFMRSLNGQAWTSTTLSSADVSAGGDFIGLAYGSGKYYATLENDIIFSSDDGSQWETTALGSDIALTGISHGGDVAMAIGVTKLNSGIVFTSSDGGAWTRSDPGTGELLTGIAHGSDRRFYVVGTSLLLMRTVNQTSRKGGGGGCSTIGEPLGEAAWPGVLGVTLVAIALFVIRKRQLRFRV